MWKSLTWEPRFATGPAAGARRRRAALIVHLRFGGPDCGRLSCACACACACHRASVLGTTHRTSPFQRFRRGWVLSFRTEILARPFVRRIRSPRDWRLALGARGALFTERRQCLRWMPTDSGAGSRKRWGATAPSWGRWGRWGPESGRCAQLRGPEDKRQARVQAS